ncbi:phage tail protein [Rhodospirillum sp. A1_3_36]|uniref:phage tail protein n=1 Tax=Rhodospirillum sp. A1_3_36 TaxID=3391666 RepID=UPI0039A4AB73
MEPFLGQISIFPWAYAPPGWALCDGTMLPITDNAALYSLIGTYFGGDGVTSFALPDLRGRVPICAVYDPQGGGNMAEKGGEEIVTLSDYQMPPHTHEIRVTSDPGTAVTGGDAYFAALSHAGNVLYRQPTPPANHVSMNEMVVQATGGGLPHTNIQPSLVLNFCIATKGMYPQRP